MITRQCENNTLLPSFIPLYDFVYRYAPNRSCVDVPFMNMNQIPESWLQWAFIVQPLIGFIQHIGYLMIDKYGLVHILLGGIFSVVWGLLRGSYSWFRKRTIFIYPILSIGYGMLIVIFVLYPLHVLDSNDSRIQCDVDQIYLIILFSIVLLLLFENLTIEAYTCFMDRLVEICTSLCLFPILYNWIYFLIFQIDNDKFSQRSKYYNLTYCYFAYCTECPCHSMGVDFNSRCSLSFY